MEGVGTSLKVVTFLPQFRPKVSPTSWPLTQEEAEQLKKQATLATKPETLLPRKSELPAQQPPEESPEQTTQKREIIKDDTARLNPEVPEFVPVQQVPTEPTDWVKVRLLPQFSEIA